MSQDQPQQPSDQQPDQSQFPKAPARPKPRSPQTAKFFNNLPPMKQALAKLRPTLEQLQTQWSLVLTKIRTLLPESLNVKLSSRALTGAIVGLLTLVLWITSNLFSRNPPNVTEVPPKTLSPTALSTPSELMPPEKTLETGGFPAVESPPLPLELTPEQSLIAAIQDQVAEVTNQSADGLIQSVLANFRSSRLIVKVSLGWYDLARSRQDKLADEMLQRAQELDFSRLEITDTEGTLLARSPVVGSNMVVLRRTVEGSSEL